MLKSTLQWWTVFVFWIIHCCSCHSCSCSSCILQFVLLNVKKSCKFVVHRIFMLTQLYETEQWGTLCDCSCGFVICIGHHHC